ncbi:hypothetical protein ACRALDRAFT_207679 [Sodiomyces alcalophilus JCM 7366]|uniref:uncharacterized protein n=1 Tax=Sodiomyces alcalophilus JCM 7366 TaxID=591952 RepID=UPI0039B3A141
MAFWLVCPAQRRWGHGLIPSIGLFEDGVTSVEAIYDPELQQYSVTRTAKDTRSYKRE